MFSFKILDLSYFDQLVSLSHEVYEKMPIKEYWGGINDDDFKMMLEHPNYIVGAFYKDELIGFMSSYNPNNHDLEAYEIIDDPSNYIFLHGVMVKDEYSGNKIAYKMGLEILKRTNKKYVLATAHPNNVKSIKTLEKLGLKTIKTMNVYYGYRSILIKEL